MEARMYLRMKLNGVECGGGTSTKGAALEATLPLPEGARASSSSIAASGSPTPLSPEQKERIAKNRLRALQLKAERRVERSRASRKGAALKSDLSFSGGGNCDGQACSSAEAPSSPTPLSPKQKGRIAESRRRALELKAQRQVERSSEAAHGHLSSDQATAEANFWSAEGTRAGGQISKNGEGHGNAGGAERGSGKERKRKGRLQSEYMADF